MNTPERQQRFQSSIEQHRRIIFKVCFSYCRNPNDRDDLAQEILVELWSAFPAYDPAYRFSTWMYRIALNVAISFYRRENSRSRHIVPGQAIIEVAAEDSSPPEEWQAVFDCIQRLNALDKALMLLYLDGNSYQEIAGVLGITETNVASKISRMKQSMRKELVV
jgi:RNA polymerase sigma-70 factor (ECF subfamily)